MNEKKPWFAKGWLHLCLWSFGMFILVIGAWISGKPIPDGAIVLFGIVIGAYTTNKTIVKTKKQQVEMHNEKVFSK